MTAAIASFPAGTSGSSSRTWSTASSPGRGRQEDFGVEPFQRQLELVLVRARNDELEVELTRTCLKVVEPLRVIAHLADAEQHRVGRAARLVGRRVDVQQHG